MIVSRTQSSHKPPHKKAMAVAEKKSTTSLPPKPAKSELAVGKERAAHNESQAVGRESTEISELKGRIRELEAELEEHRKAKAERDWREAKGLA